MEKLGKQVKKEKESLVYFSKDELVKLKKANPELAKTMKKVRKDMHESSCENTCFKKREKVKKENGELKENLKLFDQVNKKNEDLEARIKLLKKKM